MARTLTPDVLRFSIAVLAALLVSFAESSLGQIGAILLGALVGLILCRTFAQESSGNMSIKVRRTTGLFCLSCFALLLVSLPLISGALNSHALAVFAAFYRFGALVFGGGHVVLPLLREAVVKPGWVSENTFLAGYGAAQAVPGPLFTVSAYLGASLKSWPNGLLGSLVALTGIFLPGILILMGALPFWHDLRALPFAQAALRGINAAVVGILAAALYDPGWKSSVGGWRDIVLAVAGFVSLTAWKRRPGLL